MALQQVPHRPNRPWRPSWQSPPGGAGTQVPTQPWIQGGTTGGNPPSGGDHAVSIGKLQMQIKGAFAWLGILTGVFIGALWVFSGDLTDIRKDISNVNSNVAVQTKSIDDIGKTVDRIETKVDAQDTESGRKSGK